MSGTWPDWQPMETAPRDGTNILLCHSVFGLFTASWRKDDFPRTPWLSGGGGIAHPDDADMLGWLPLPEAPDA